VNVYIFMVLGYWYPDEVQKVISELFGQHLEVDTVSTVIVIHDPGQRLSLYQIEDLDSYFRSHHRDSQNQRQAQDGQEYMRRWKRFLDKRDKDK